MSHHDCLPLPLGPLPLLRGAARRTGDGLRIVHHAERSVADGGTHDATASFWRDGGLATDGIRDMAERGRTSPLDDEINAAVRAGSAGAVSTGGQISATPGTVSLEFDIRQRHPLVTFVSMVAPSPDWFVGVSGLPLFENGRWVSERRVELAPNGAVRPLGTFVFTRIQ